MWAMVVLLKDVVQLLVFQLFQDSKQGSWALHCRPWARMFKYRFKRVCMMFGPVKGDTM